MSVIENETYRTLFLELMQYCLARGIPFAEAQDLVGASVEAALRKYDPARGAFAALAQTALVNRVKNHWRDRKQTGPLDDAGGLEDPDTRPDAFDDNGYEQAWLRTIMAALAPEEKEFLLALHGVLEEMDTRAVSEAARRLGITPLKGWDLLRKIRRKATRTGTAAEEQLPFGLDRTLPVRMRSVEETPDVIAGAGAPPAPLPRVVREQLHDDVDADIRLLAAFAAMERAFERFHEGLAPETLALLGRIR